VTSLGRRYEDMVCFVPNVTLSWSVMLENFMKVVEELAKIGLIITSVLVDGHTTNV
jgi:hypothetical protein